MEIACDRILTNGKLSGGEAIGSSATPFLVRSGQDHHHEDKCKMLSRCYAVPVQSFTAAAVCVSVGTGL